MRQNHSGSDAAAKGNHRFPFSKRRLEALPTPQGGRVYWYDTQAAGLAICVMPSGAKSFYVVKFYDGAKKRISLGKFPEVTVENARTSARELVGEIAKGNDPHAVRLAKCHEQTIDGLFAFWLENAKARGVKTWGEDENRYKRFLKPWGNRKLSAIKKSDVAALFAKVTTENGRYAANRLLALVKSMFHKAPDMGFTGPDPTAGVKKHREERRDRFLHADELKSFFVALFAEPNATLRDLLLVCLLTGARKTNVMEMQWGQIDFATGLWRIPQTKSGKPVVIPLVGAAVAILTTRRNTANGSPWVFPSRGRGNTTGHITEIKERMEANRHRGETGRLPPHDLRRSLASHMAIGGTGLPVIGAMLGHSQPSTTAIYARLEQRSHPHRGGECRHVHVDGRQRDDRQERYHAGRQAREGERQWLRKRHLARATIAHRRCTRTLVPRMLTAETRRTGRWTATRLRWSNSPLESKWELEMAVRPLERDWPHLAETVRTESRVVARDLNDIMVALAKDPVAVGYVYVAFHLGVTAGKLLAMIDYDKFVHHAQGSDKVLPWARASKSVKARDCHTEIRAAVQRKLDAGLSLNCAQHRVAEEREAACPKLTPYSFSQVWRITRNMEAKKKNRK